MNPPWFDDSESDDEDWLSESIRKYKHFFRYKFENTPLQIKIHPKGKYLLLLCETIKKNYEILVFKIPEKILAISEKEEGLINSRELTLVCGCHESRKILDINFDPNEELSVLILFPNGLEKFKQKTKHSDLLISEVKFEGLSGNTIGTSDQGHVYIIGEKIQFVDSDQTLSFTDFNAMDLLTYFSEKDVLEKWCIAKSDMIEILKSNGESLIKVGLKGKRFKELKLRKIGQDIHFIAQDCLDQLFHGIISESDLNLVTVDFQDELKKMVWIDDTKILVIQNKALKVIEITSGKILFTHETSKKATEITSIALHPTLSKLIACCDDSRAVEIFCYE